MSLRWLKFHSENIKILLLVQPTKKRKVFQIMVECLQNICKYAGQDEGEPFRSAIFMVGKIDNEYTITTGNMILKEKVEFLNSLISKINSLDAEVVQAIERLNRIRNQIQHRGTRIDEKSKWMFTETFNTITLLYKKEFPKRRCVGIVRKSGENMNWFCSNGKDP